eukprot:symbB.v1.2.027230.t1/scaffold2778.1/size70658/8
MNNYHLYEEIGRGKYSQVYKGRKKFTIQFVAVKSIEKCRREKVMTEVELLSGLHHANVIEFVNCYETRNHLWVIFEYCAGGDLLRLLKQDSRLPEERVRVFGRQICAGLLHLHSRGIIFCDLKPSNILFTEDEILKLSHFGQALRMEAVESQAPSRRGTPQYMAPELFSEAGVHSFSSDLWSLGCVLHELFLGSPPFTSVSSQQLATAVVTAAVPKMPGATPEFQDLTLDLLRPLHRRIAWPQLRSHRWWRGERLGEDNDVAHVPKKRPPRRWMSVSDLVTEVEQALVEGERLDEDSPAYFNLRREARDGADVSALWIFGAVELWKALSLRLENDALNEKVAELEEARAQYIAQEEGLTAKLKEDGGFFAHEKDIMEMTSKIQEVDYKIAGLRHKHHHNIKDVGSLKRTMSLIEKRGKAGRYLGTTMVVGSSPELGSLFSKMFLPKPKGSPAPKAKGGSPKPSLSRGEPDAEEDTDVTDAPAKREDAPDGSDGSTPDRAETPENPEVAELSTVSAPVARPATRPMAPRRLGGLKPMKPGSNGLNGPMVPQVSGTPRPPMRLKVPESRKRKVPEPPSNPPEVWERVIDASRNAVYYWEHRTKRSSWDVPPVCFGWWERLRTEHTNMEFFWNSATRQTVWTLPLTSKPSAAAPLALALSDDPSVCRSLPLPALPPPDYDKCMDQSQWLEDNIKEVTTLIDKTEEALDKGEVSHAVQLEADLTQVVERLRQESAKIWPKISSYEANIADLSGKMSETQNQLQAVLHTPTREADDLRTFLKSQINQVKRMLAQLGRLRDIQRVNAQEIGMVERERAKLQRYCLVRELLEEGDKAKLRDKITVLQEDADRLRTAIKELESRLSPLTAEAWGVVWGCGWFHVVPMAAASSERPNASSISFEACPSSSPRRRGSSESNLLPTSIRNLHGRKGSRFFVVKSFKTSVSLPC